MKQQQATADLPVNRPVGVRVAALRAGKSGKGKSYPHVA